MSWFKVDDGFWSHPKTLALPPAAIALWVRAGAWSCQQLTDGFVPDHALVMFGPLVGQEHADLVAVGYWDRDDERGGYVFHDWDEYQESSSVVKKRRADARERMRIARDKKRGSGERSQGVRANNTRTFADGSREVRITPTRPDPTSTSNEVETPQAPQGGPRGQRLSANWMPDAELISKMRTECPDVDLKHEHQVFVDYWIAQPGAKGRKADWPATWRNWMRRKQDDQTKGTRQTPEQRARTTLALATDIDTREISA